MLSGKDIHAVELSALRQNELQPLVTELEALDLAQFRYVSVHAPSQIRKEDEEEAVDRLMAVFDRRWPIILHPDAVNNWSLWRRFGGLLCVENMDKRKPAGRTAQELNAVFDRVPEASLCFDIGHARQVDSTMTEAYFILKCHGSRLRQVHVSEVNSRSKHDPLSYASILAFQEVAEYIPRDVPLILEAPVSESQMETEMARVREALPLPEQALQRC